MNPDADVAPLTAPDALDDGDRLRFALSEMPVVAPRRWEAQRDHSVRSTSGAKNQSAADGAARSS